MDTSSSRAALAAAARPLTDDFTAGEIDRAARRRRETRPTALAGTLLGLAVTVVLGLTPVGAGVVRWAGDLLGGGWVARAALGSVALAVLGTLVDLPLDLRGEVVNRRWGLSRRTWGLYAMDRAKGFLIGAALGAAVLTGFYWLVRLTPLWWLWAALAAAALVVLASFIVPVLIEPVFNKFTPMPDGPLRTRLMALVAESGVDVRDILVSDSSRRTTAANAYVSGLGRTRRLVVWDTTAEAFAPEEVAAVAAHEIGHAARRDVLLGTVLGAVGSAVTVAAMALLLHWPPLLRAAGVDDLADPRSQALVAALLTAFGAVGSPFFLTFSRFIETRADGYALDLFQDPATIVRMEHGLAVKNIAELSPSRLRVLLAYSHPPIPDRMAHARAWAAAHGRPVPGPLTDAGDPGTPASPAVPPITEASAD